MFRAAITSVRPIFFAPKYDSNSARHTKYSGKSRDTCMILKSVIPPQRVVKITRLVFDLSCSNKKKSFAVHLEGNQVFYCGGICIETRWRQGFAIGHHEYQLKEESRCCLIRTTRRIEHQQNKLVSFNNSRKVASIEIVDRLLEHTLCCIWKQRYCLSVTKLTYNNRLRFKI